MRPFCPSISCDDTCIPFLSRLSSSLSPSICLWHLSNLCDASLFCVSNACISDLCSSCDLCSVPIYCVYCSHCICISSIYSLIASFRACSCRTYPSYSTALSSCFLHSLFHASASRCNSDSNVNTVMGSSTVELPPVTNCC